MPAGTLVTVLIPKGEAVLLGGMAYQENDTYAIPATVFIAPVQPTPQPDPAAPVRALTATQTLNIRADPDANSAKLGTVQAGDSVQVTDDMRSGYIKLYSRPGWIVAAYLH